MEIHKEYISKIKEKFSLEQVESYLDKIKNLKVLVIGDTIIDEYYFTSPKGRAIKDPIMSVDYINHEVYMGGILAIANHVSNFVDNINLITLLGDKNSKKDVILKLLNKNICHDFFIKENSPTTVKRRFIDNMRGNKLFKIEYMNDSPINKKLENEIINYLKQELPKYDVVIVGDFGHGFINNEIAEVLQKYSKYLCLNVQTNSANYGFNLITKYHKSNFINMDANELELALFKKFGDIDLLVKDLGIKKTYGRILVTKGKGGSTYLNKKDELIRAPAFTSNIVDVVGAGDAVFSVVSLMTYINAPDELIPFIGNCVGGIAVGIMGNKESVTREKLVKFIKGIY